MHIHVTHTDKKGKNPKESENDRNLYKHTTKLATILNNTTKQLLIL